MTTAGDNEEEQRRRRLEEELEIKSLKRIINAYFNYPDASEEDVRRYERSFRMLPPEHKAPSGVTFTVRKNIRFYFKSEDVWALGRKRPQRKEL